MAYMDDSRAEPHFVLVRIPGRIALEPRGELQAYHWSPLAMIFIPENSKKTLGEMNEEEYLAWRDAAHKPSVSKEFVKWFTEYKGLKTVVI